MGLRSKVSAHIDKTMDWGGNIPTGVSLYRRITTEPRPPKNVPFSADANGESASSESKEPGESGVLAALWVRKRKPEAFIPSHGAGASGNGCDSDSEVDQLIVPLMIDGSGVGYSGLPGTRAPRH